MTVQEPTSQVALPDRARPLRFGYYAIRTLVVVALLAAAALLPGRSGPSERYRYREGDIARERIVAPQDFRIDKDEATLRREQEQAAAAVPPVFAVDSRVSAEALNRFATFHEKVMAIAFDPTIAPDDRRDRIRALGVPLSPAAAAALASAGRARRALEQVGISLHELYEAGIVADKRAGTLLGYRAVALRDGDTETLRPVMQFRDRREALDLIATRAHDAFPGDPRGEQLVNEMAATFVQPNVLFDRAETDWRRVQAQGAVPAFVGFVQKNELIVDANQKVTRDAALKLHSLFALEVGKRLPSEYFYPPLARMLLMLFFIVVFAIYLRIELPHVFRNDAMLVLFTLLTVAVMGASQLQVGVLGLSEFTVPLALAPLVVASLLEKRPALMFTMVLVVVATSVSGLHAPFVPVAALGGVTAVYSVSRLRHRWHFALAFLTIAVANLVAILAWDLTRSAPTGALLLDGSSGALNAFLAVGAAFLLLPPVESLLGLTSDMTLLELSDLNRPLLKRLQFEAPGTYHHSMIVGSLAEAAAEGIGANSLLARVMSYYHDIGKLTKPEYYHENEFATTRSRHEKLSPSMSALVVRSHITDGLDLARKHRLPRAVVDSIPEHHGSMVMAFFYSKAFDQNPAVLREDFCYPGPKPRSKETAILMLADGVEGASRALEQPTPSRLRGLIARIVEDRVQQGQFDDCGLTFQELARIREAFFRVLSAVFHGRSPYPEPPKPKPRADADLRREPR